jgi:hypothetical protein
MFLESKTLRASLRLQMAQVIQPGRVVVKSVAACARDTGGTAPVGLKFVVIFVVL